MGGSDSKDITLPPIFAGQASHEEPDSRQTSSRIDILMPVLTDDSINASLGGTSSADSLVSERHHWFTAPPIPYIGNRAASFDHDAKRSLPSLSGNNEMSVQHKEAPEDAVDNYEDFVLTDAAIIETENKLSSKFVLSAPKVIIG